MSEEDLTFEEFQAREMERDLQSPVEQEDMLRHQFAELEADKRRLDWLETRRKDQRLLVVLADPGKALPDLGPRARESGCPTLRAAIDAAMSAEEAK